MMRWNYWMDRIGNVLSLVLMVQAIVLISLIVWWVFTNGVACK